MTSAHRILFVSHDHRGLGHTRRTIATCRGILDEFANASALLMTGSHDVSLSAVHPRADYVELPSIKRDAEGKYFGRLSRSIEEIEAFRGAVVREAIRWFRPTIVMVDSLPPVPRGGEIIEALRYLKATQPAAVRILLLRDIINAPPLVKRQWEKQHAYQIMRDDYDRIVIFGQPDIFDLLEEYDVPADIRQKSRYVGYLSHVADAERVESLRRAWCQGDQRILLTMVGGGSDGQPVIDAVRRALPAIAAAVPIRAVFLPGPDCPPETVRSLEGDDRLVVTHRCDDAVNYIAASDVVVSMAGFNSINEVVALRRQAVVCPRQSLDGEQHIRAERFASLGLLDWIPREELGGSRLTAAVLDCLKSPRNRASQTVRLDAGREICAALASDPVVERAARSL